MKYERNPFHADVEATICVVSIISNSILDEKFRVYSERDYTIQSLMDTGSHVTW